MKHVNTFKDHLNEKTNWSLVNKIVRLSKEIAHNKNTNKDDAFAEATSQLGIRMGDGEYHEAYSEYFDIIEGETEDEYRKRVAGITED